MQAELLRLTDALQAAGRQIVLTSDRPPAEIEDARRAPDPRFAGGLIVDIGAPDYETRVAILRRKAEERAGRVRSRACSRRSPRLGVRQRARAAGRAQPAGRLPGGERHAARPRAGAQVAASGREPRCPPAAPAARRPSAQPTAGRVRGFLSDVDGHRRRSRWRRGGPGSRRRCSAGRARGTARGRLERCSSRRRRTTPTRPSRDFAADVERLQALEAEVARSSIRRLAGPARRSAIPSGSPRRRSRPRAPGPRAAPPPAPSAALALATFAVESVEPARRPCARPSARGRGAGPAATTRSCSSARAASGKTHLLHAIGNRAGASAAARSSPA